MRLALLMLILQFNPALAATGEEKLRGPVTGFIRTAEIRHLGKTTYLQWPAAKPSARSPIVIIPGRGEIVYGWAETAYDLRQSGFDADIYVWQPLGQGISDKLYPTDPGIVHIQRFRDYVMNLLVLLEHSKKTNGKPARLIAHSMGGTISILAAEERGDLIEDILLIAPALEIHFGSPFLNAIVRSALALVDALPFSDQIRFHTSRRRSERAAARNARWSFAEQYEVANGAVMNGESLHWVVEFNRAIAEALSGANSLTLPILLLEAGNDSIIDPVGDRILRERCKDNCRVEVIRRSSHSMHEEQDKIRNQMMGHALPWFGLEAACEELLSVEKKKNAG